MAILRVADTLKDDHPCCFGKKIIFVPEVLPNGSPNPRPKLCPSCSQKGNLKLAPSASPWICFYSGHFYTDKGPCYHTW